MSKILKDIKIVLLSIVISFGISLVYAWNGPISAPPNYNAYTPINVSAASQTKSGSLWAGAFLTEGGGYFGGNVGIGVTNPQTKLHIGGTAGVDGIKFPDGTVQTTACAVSAAPGSETFTTNGTFTVPANVRSITVEVRGGGGGGGGRQSVARSCASAGGGGGSGGYGRSVVNVYSGQSFNVVSGAGGSPGVRGSSGTNGGTSSFGDIVYAIGGSGGGGGNISSCSASGGAGGTSNGTYNISGNNGGGTSYCSLGIGGGGVGGYGSGGNGGSCGMTDTEYYVTNASIGSPGQQGQVIVSW